MGSRFRIMNYLKHILLLFFLWRVFLLIPLYIGSISVAYRNDQPYTTIWNFIKPYPPVNHPLLYPLANFDGVHYLSIAAFGYNNNERFFPLYPLLIRLISSIFGNGSPFGNIQFFSALFISNISFLLSLIVFYKLLRLDFSDTIAKRTILFLLVFPTSFFFITLYSEGLFLLLTLLSFYYARKKMWIKASLFGMFLTTTRLVGIAILPVLLLEFFLQHKNSLTKDYKKALCLLLVSAGIISFSFFNYATSGDLLRFIKAHTEIANSRSESIVLIPQTLFRYTKILTTIPTVQFEWWIAALELTSFFFVLFLLYVAWKKSVRASYVIFGLICFLLPVLSGTFSGLPRYSLLVFPIFIALALVQSKKLQVVYTTISLILLFILFLFFSKGYYIA